MAGKFPSAKITDLSVIFDAAPTATAAGPVLWGAVVITYASEGTEPSVTIRVALPWSGLESAEERKSEALRRARQLIDHACQASGLAVAAGREETVEPKATVLEGLSQELGLSPPTTTPVRVP